MSKPFSEPQLNYSRRSLAHRLLTAHWLRPLSQDIMPRPSLAEEEKAPLEGGAKGTVWRDGGRQEAATAA